MGAQEETLTLVLKARDLASKEIGGFGKSIGGLVSPMALVAGGAVALVGGLAAAVGAAVDEQKNIAKLDAALKANVKGWDGNTQAIEDAIAKREDLAFSDDSLRSSMATLVTSTGDVSKALDLQTLAMDLARAKGVDLETASTAIAKATQGSTRELKALGLEVDDTATAQENLARIQKATAGQASAYAATMSGKWETFQNKVGDVVEGIGGALLPIVEGLMDFLLTTGIPAFQSMADILGPILGFILDIGNAVRQFLQPAFDAVVGTIKTVLGWLNGLIEAIRTFLGLDDKADRSGAYGRANASGSPDERAGFHAAGGRVMPGWTWVGETGPELVRFGAPADILSHADSDRLVAGTPANPVVLAINLDGREVARVVDDHLHYRAQRAGTA